MLNRALKMLRVYHGLAQSDLASRLNLSNSYLSEIESGSKQPSLDVLKKYSDFFKMPLSSIMLFSEEIGRGQRAGKFRITAAEKVLKLLEWLEDKNEIRTDKETAKVEDFSSKR